MRQLFRGVRALVTGGLCAFAWTTAVSEATVTAATQTDTPAEATQMVSTVSYNGQEFLSSFNSARSETRLVLIFSPT